MKDIENPTIETNKNFKENIKNIFLHLNELAVNCILITEHIAKKVEKSNKEIFEEIINKELKNVESQIKTLFNSIYQKAFDKADRITFFPLIFDEKKTFRREKTLIHKQFSKLRSIEYNQNFNINKIFLARLEDFFRIVKEDCEFEIPKGMELEEVKKKYKEEAEKEDLEWEYSDEEGGVEAIGEQKEDEEEDKEGEGEEEGEKKRGLFDGFYQINDQDEFESKNNGIGNNGKKEVGILK